MDQLVEMLASIYGQFGEIGERARRCTMRWGSSNEDVFLGLLQR